MTRLVPLLLALTALALPHSARAADSDEEVKKVLGKVDSYKEAFKKAQDLDLTQAVTVSNLELPFDSMKLTLQQGSLFPRQTIEGKVFGVVWIGTGRMAFTPPDRLEGDELARYTESRALDLPIDQALFIFDTDLWDQIKAKGTAGAVDKKVSTAAEKVWKTRREALSNMYGNDEFSDLGMWITETLARGTPTGFTLIDMHTEGVKKGKDWISYGHHPAWREEVVLMRLWPYPLNPDRWYGESICSFQDAAGRAASSREQAYENKQPVDMKNYVSDFSIYRDANDDKINLKAKVTAEFVSQRDNLGLVRLLLINENGGDLTVRGVTLGDKTPLPFLHQNDEILVELPKPLAKGEKGTLTFHYSGPIIDAIVQPKPQATIEQQNAASGDDKAALSLVSYGLLNTYPWFPQTPGTSDRYTWDWTVRTQQPLEAAVSGTTMDEKVEGGMKVLHVVETVSSVLPAIIIGRYTVASDSVQLPDGRTVGLRVYSHPGTQSVGAKDLLQQAKECLLVYTQYFGPYPYTELDLAQMAYGVGFAQAPAGLVQMTGEVYLSKTFLATFYRYRDPQLSDYFIPHEVAHQWWGHRVGWATYRDQWMSETLAEFSAALFMEVSRGAKGYTDRRNTWEMEGGFKPQKTGPLWLGGRNDERYQMTVYRRGPLLMDKLLKDLGREKTMLALRAIADAVNNNAASTEDLQKAFESATGLGFEDFFRLYVKDNVDLNATPEDIAAILAGKPLPSATQKGGK